MKKAPIALGIITMIYWLVAFLVGWVATFADQDSAAHHAWWNNTILREPGRWVGFQVYDALEYITGLDYGVLIGWPLIVALLVTSVFLGYSVWFFSLLAISRIERRRYLDSMRT